MDVRAAVATAPGKPLEVTTVTARGPARRRGTGRDQGDRNLPHRRIHPLGRRSGGPVSGDPRPRRCGRRRRCRAGRDFGQKRRPRHSALHAGMPDLPVMSVAQDQSVHRHPRDAGPRRHAGRHLALLARWQETPSLYGLLDLRQFHRAAGDRGGENPRRRPIRQGLLHRLRRNHRHRRGDQHRESRARREMHRVRPWRHRAQRHPGAAAGRRRHDHRRRSQSRARRPGANASA